MHKQPRLLAAFGLLFYAVSLGGCVVSKAPLFEVASAVAPVAPGRFQTQERRGGEWHLSKVGTLELRGKQYTWKAEEDGRMVATPLWLFDIGDGLVVSMSKRAPNGARDEYYYDLWELEGLNIHSYGVTCEALSRVRLNELWQPRMNAPDFFCRYADAPSLVAALRAFAIRNLPITQLVRKEP